jgi:predicted amidohydrolase YtcJ
MPKIIFPVLSLLLCAQNALAQAPVVLTGPVPAIAPNYAVGSSRIITYTITNRVPNQSFPLSITGISSAVKRVAVANDCGNNIPPGPASCNFGLRISPSAEGNVQQVVKVDYRGRVPLTSKIVFSSVLPAYVIYTYAKIETIDSKMSTAESVAIRGSEIIGVGSNSSMIEQFQGPSTTVIDLQGTTILPGFIATHQHALGWGSYTNKNWLDVSSVNILLKPPVDDPRCIDKTDFQSCFIPVQTQADVNNRLLNAIATAPTPKSRIFAASYDPSRLGHGTNCNPAEGLGFQCDNFENGHAREVLDGMSTSHPILITSESGHIVYVNTAYLKLLNICGTDVAGPNCLQPIFNVEEEQKMANLGQLNEDLALYAEANAAAHISKKDPSAIIEMLERTISTMHEHGFTLIQEGAASEDLMELWAEVSKAPKFPFKVALFAYESTSPTVDSAVSQAKAIRAANRNNPNVFVAAIKMFADGSTQGYTGFMIEPYHNVYPPFTNASIFEQPYVGLFDSDEAAIAQGAMTAHAAHFPLAVHQNGDAAIANAMNGLRAAGTPPRGIRDILIHFSLATPGDIDAAIELGVGSTFLIENTYFYGLPLCQQVLGQKRTKRIYPAGLATRKGLRFGLHSDAPVTPPYPLFAIWVAKTRLTQQPSWYPNQNPEKCPVTMAPGESISIAQGIKAFTIDGAWTYGLEKQMGSIEVGKLANLVFLSADPLSMENNPNGLRNIRVLATLYRGQFLPNPHAAEKPVWPE